MNALHSGKEQDIESLYNRVAFCCALVTVLIAGTTSVLWVLSVFDSTDPYQHFDFNSLAPDPIKEKSTLCNI